MKIAIDFDGVIVKREEIPRQGSFVKYPPLVNSKEAVGWLLSLGHDLYILTNRNGRDHTKIRQWLSEWKFPKLKVTNVKQKGTSVYIDDRAIRFTNWLDICKYFG